MSFCSLVAPHCINNDFSISEYSRFRSYFNNMNFLGMLLPPLVDVTLRGLFSPSYCISNLQWLTTLNLQEALLGSWLPIGRVLGAFFHTPNPAYLQKNWRNISQSYVASIPFHELTLVIIKCPSRCQTVESSRTAFARHTKVGKLKELLRPKINSTFSLYFKTM